MLNEIEAKKRVELALQNVKEYIENENKWAENFNKEKIEECLRLRSEYLGLNQKILWLEGLSKDSFSSLESFLGSSLESSLWSSLASSLASSLGSSLESSLGSSFGSSLESSLWSSLESSLWSSLASSLRSSLGSSLASSLGSSFYLIWWDSEYLAANDKTLKEYSKFMKEAIQNGLGFILDFEKAIIVIPMPKFSKDEKRRLHNENGEAVLWRDGFKRFHLWGVEFDEELYWKIMKKELSVKDILGIQNIEQRMIAMKVKGMENFLSELNAKLLDKSERGNELYLIENIFNQPAYFLKYICPSTGRIFMKGIDPKIGQSNNADKCQAESFGWSLEEYNKLEIES